MPSNLEILQQLGARPELLTAIKGITEVSALGDSVLQPMKQVRFIEEMQYQTAVLPRARFQNMTAKKMDIDRIGFTGRVIRSGKNAAGAHRSLTTSEFAEPDTVTNQLITNELIAITSLRDDTVRENLQRGTLEDLILEMFGRAAGRDFEEYALFADTNIPYAEDDVLSKTDGWIAKAGSKLYGRNVATQLPRDFDSADANFPENMFEAMVEAMPKQFLADPADFVLYVDWATENAYRNLLRARGTALGDQTTTGRVSPPWKGFPLVIVPMFARSASVDVGVDATVLRDRVEGRVAILAQPNNMIWGVFHEVTVEPEREAKERRTDFVLTFEADAGYEDENATVVAFIDKANPTAV